MLWMRSNVDKDDPYSNGTFNPHMTSVLILKNNIFCDSQNINELKNWKLELELHFLALNLLAQSMLVECDDC